MKRILLTALLFLSLTVCFTSAVWAGGLDDFKAGIAAAEGGNYDEAIRLLDNAFRSGDLLRGEGILEKLAIAYCYRGVAWYGKGDYGRAINDLTDAIKRNPKYANAYCMRGLVWYSKGEVYQAIADFTAAIQINPMYAVAYFKRGCAWDNIGDYNKAKGDYDKAKADYDKAKEIDPSLTPPARGGVFDDLKAGIEAAEGGNYDEAERLLTKAIRSGELTQKRLAIAYCMRGLVWYSKGEYGRAINDLTDAIKINPKYADAYRMRGAAWEKKGDHDKAKADLTKAKEIDASIGR